jgi:hypothetical protein
MPWLWVKMMKMKINQRENHLQILVRDLPRKLKKRTNRKLIMKRKY